MELHLGWIFKERKPGPESTPDSRRNKSRFQPKNWFYGIHHKRSLLALLLMFDAAVFGLDLLIDPRISFGPVYSIPILLAAWFFERRIAFLFVAISSLARVYTYGLALAMSTPLLFESNLFITFAVYLVIAEIMLRIKHFTSRLSTHADYLQHHVKHMQHKYRVEDGIRRALPEEADEIVRLTIAGANNGCFDDEVLTTVKQHSMSLTYRQGIVEGLAIRDLWKGGQASVPVEFWVSVVNENIAGFLMILGIDEKKNADRELHVVVVSEKYRGLGIGSAMVNFFCKHYKNRRLFAACRPGSIMMKMLGSRAFKATTTTTSGYVFMEKLTD